MILLQILLKYYNSGIKPYRSLTYIRFTSPAEVSGKLSLQWVLDWVQKGVTLTLLLFLITQAKNSLQSNVTRKKSLYLDVTLFQVRMVIIKLFFVKKSDLVKYLLH